MRQARVTRWQSQLNRQRQHRMQNMASVMALMMALTGVTALSIVGCRNPGGGALHSGMNKKEVIAVLGEPNCSDITRDRFPQHRTG